MAYDVGTVFGLGFSTRPRFAPDQVRRELEIIRRDLHCNAIKVGGTDPRRIATASTFALELGLEVWFSPAIYEKSPPETLRRIVQAAHLAEAVRKRSGGTVVFCVGQELTLFMRGLLPGRSFLGRWRNPATREILRSGKHRPALNAFLANASAATRQVFHGPVAYAALPFEGVEWEPFDVVGVDHYWDERIRDRYTEMLRPFLSYGKPVVVTGTGSRAYRGAHSSGTLGLGVVDVRSQFLHHLPLIGRFVRPHLNGSYVRDEGAQAERLTAVLTTLRDAGVDGVFIDSFAEYDSPYSEDPRYDLDMSSVALVKTLEHGQGTVYPDMPWEPKEAFRAVADFYSK